MPINNSDNHEINRGIELMLRGEELETIQSNENGILIYKELNFFGIKIIFHFHIFKDRNN
jgi:hypothetical protein